MYRDDQSPTEYGGNPSNPRLMPNGQLRPKTVQEEARDMRREGIRDFDGDQDER